MLANLYSTDIGSIKHNKNSSYLEDREMLRKSLSKILAAVMTFTILPVGVRAEETEKVVSEKTVEEITAQEEQPLEVTDTVVPQKEDSDEERSSEGEAYAVYTDDDELVLFRSFEQYENKAYQTVTDITGYSYTGVIYANIENYETDTENPKEENVPWYDNRTQIKSIRVADSQVIQPKSCAYWFASLRNLSNLDLNGLDTSQTVNISFMFEYCGLRSIDLSGFKTSNVTDMKYLFDGCTSLESVDISGFDTSQVKYMQCMFWHCDNLQSIDLSSFDTSNVESMYWMFYMCTSLTELDVTNFNTSKVTNMFGMFDGCSKITEIDLSSFDTSAVTNMNDMFNGCRSLKKLNVNHFDTSNVTSMGGMFRYCSSLKELNLSNFDTSSVRFVGPNHDEFYGMFENCSNLTELDLSSFDTSNVTSMYHLFYNCSSLIRLNISNFDLTMIESMEEMFYGLTSLEEISLGERFNKWLDGSYLPAGTWKNQRLNLSLTEQELYKQYPNNASEWKGIWTRKNNECAVLTEDRELIFFETNENYVDQTTGDVTDIKGNTYTGAYGALAEPR